MIIFGSFAFDSRTWCVFEESLSFSGVCLWFSLMMLYIFHDSVSLEQLVAPDGDPVSGLIFFCFFSWAGCEAAAYWQTHCCVFTVMRRCTTFRCNISQLQIAWSLVTVAAGPLPPSYSSSLPPPPPPALPRCSSSSSSPLFALLCAAGRLAPPFIHLILLSLCFCGFLLLPFVTWRCTRTSLLALFFFLFDSLHVIQMSVSFLLCSVFIWF